MVLQSEFWEYECQKKVTPKSKCCYGQFHNERLFPHVVGRHWLCLFVVLLYPALCLPCPFRVQTLPRGTAASDCLT